MTTPSVPSIPDLAERLTLREANKARQQEWDAGNQITLAYRGNELAGEVGEACNLIKKLERERLGIRGSRASKEQLAEELADVVICADLIAMDAGIDLDAAIVAKFNATSEKNGLATRLSSLEELSRLKAGEGWQPTHKHYKGGLYREIGRGIERTGHDEKEVVAVFKSRDGEFVLKQVADTYSTLTFHAAAVVTDDLVSTEPFVLYQHSSGNHYVRPARLFDEPTRFAPLPPAPGVRP